MRRLLNFETGVPICIPRRHVSPKGKGVALTSVNMYQSQYLITGGMDGSIMCTDISNANLHSRHLEAMTIARSVVGQRLRRQKLRAEKEQKLKEAQHSMFGGMSKLTSNTSVVSKSKAMQEQCSCNYR